ncbi:hypothetical protein V6N11_045490 [Hibiscus sabdariffa]|uniref:Uncharacterized protein n=1 Tax=Hibiscus sabdariffa TaxID=183260 RepID=A0ABR2Q180_9ROSI
MKFCDLVGSVPWRKLLETKRFMNLYDNVVQWKDSAGEEATVQSRYKTTRFQVTRRKREDIDRYMSRYKTTRFHRDNRQNNRGWRNPRGRQAGRGQTLHMTNQLSIRHSGIQ